MVTSLALDFLEMGGGFDSPDVNRALDFPIETLLKRIKQRGRKFELEYYNPEYLARVDSGLVKLKEKLRRKKIPVVSLGENDVVVNGKGEVEMSAALEQIKELVKSS